MLELMYKLSVPFMLSQIEVYGVEPFIAELKKIGADIVFLALDSYEVDEKKREEVFARLKKNVPIFQDAGFTVGVWVWTFMVRGDKKYTHITSPYGGVSRDQVCPSDEEFCKFAYEYLQNIARSHPDMIMFDDDFCYGFIDCGLGCTCKNHRAHMEKVLGEELPVEGLGELIFSGGRNKYRSAFLQANGHYFREFAKIARKAVDSIDPEIRLGPCSCMSHWDFDGVSTVETAKILAGKTKPFARLIGAPYWSDKRSLGVSRLQDVIEIERMESAWCDDDIELFAEGDAYPRPRFTCSANVLEGFDMALRASGALNGIHKYTLDYNANIDYEKGYNRKHLQNQAIYQKIEEVFGEKISVGVRVYEHMTKFEDMDVPAHWDINAIQNSFFSPAAKMMAAQTIPTIYKGLGVVGVAFGENAKYLDDNALDNGLILDLTAAKILQKRGVDVGLQAVNESVGAWQEYFPDQKQYVGLYGLTISNIAVNENAKIQSYIVPDGKEFDAEYIGSYSYENSNGQKFLVFAFDGYGMSEHAFKQYVRGTQIEEWIKSLGKVLPASMLGNPDCYMLCKENESGKAVWIGNFFSDECMNTTVVLDKEYTEIEFINCNGVLNGNKVTLDYIGPYASIGFNVK